MPALSPVPSTREVGNASTAAMTCVGTKETCPSPRTCPNSCIASACTSPLAPSELVDHVLLAFICMTQAVMMLSPPQHHRACPDHVLLGLCAQYTRLDARPHGPAP